MKANDLIAGLPGETIVRQGLGDLRSGNRSIAACLVSIARPRLDRAGLMERNAFELVPEPELELYRLLREEGGDAYSRYNSLVRELVSFEQALDHRLSR